jgi:hypothetical protein
MKGDVQRGRLLELLDRLDDLVRNARGVPLTDQVRIDRDALYDIVDAMRAALAEPQQDDDVR